jgi:lysozyme family protein
MPLTREVRNDYESKYQSLTVRPEFARQAETVVARITKHRPRYEAVSRTTKVPWTVIAAIHNLECSGRFDCHLHNGDPLRRRTVNVPAGRPRNGRAPFTWEASATDALEYDGFTSWTDWSIGGTLYKLEGYNGMGYRKRGIPTPYLWSGSQHYTRGKYVADGRFDPSAVSSQVGAAVLLAQLGTTAPGAPPASPRASDHDCVEVR